MTNPIASSQVHGSSQMIAFCTGRSSPNKTGTYCRKILINWKPGRRSGGWPPIQTNVVPSEYTDPGTPISMDFSLKRNILDKENKEDYTKYLGVELQSSLSWNRHIDQTVKKANNMLGFLRRNLRVNSEQTKATAYCSMVRPLLEYCSTVWPLYP